jgi:hypothetical protein
MREVKLVITINRPAAEVFAFAIDPANTPKWLDFISVEETSEWPIKIGTIYRNKGTTDSWNEYVVSDLKESELFVLSQKDGDYHVRYVVAPIDERSCKLEYYEWSDAGNLESPFTQAALDKFKHVIES